MIKLFSLIFQLCTIPITENRQERMISQLPANHPKLGSILLLTNYFAGIALILLPSMQVPTRIV
jgi:hypothetical protein